MENQNTLTEIAEIKKQLERQRKWIRWSMSGWIALAGLVTMGAAYQQSTFFKTLRVHRLALVDANGIERLILDTDNRVVNFGGKELKRGPQVSGIILQNEKGDEVGGMVTSNCNGLDIQCPSMTTVMLDGYSSFTKSGATERVGLFSREDGTAGLVVVDLKGNQRSMLTSDPDLKVSFSLNGGDEKPHIAGTVAPDGGSKWNAPVSH